MSEEKNVSIRATRRFDKALKKMNDAMLDCIDEQVDLILDDPDIGQKKKGDLNYLRVHKFKFNRQQWLLGYSFDGDALVLSLLQIGSHENYYEEAKRYRASDSDFLDS